VKPEQLMLPCHAPISFSISSLSFRFRFRDLLAITQCRRGWVFAFRDSAIFGQPIYICSDVVEGRERAKSMPKSQMASRS